MVSKDFLAQTTYRAGIMQSRAHRVMTNFMTDQLETHELSKPEWMLIGCLVESQKLRPSEAAEQLGVRPPVATKLIRSLEKKKLIQLSADRKDRRVSHMKLTKDGLKKAEHIERQLRETMAAWLSGIKREELNTYLKITEQIAHLPVAED